MTMTRMGTRETVRHIGRALEQHRTFSLVRLADGELRALQSMKQGRMPDGLSQGMGAPDAERAPEQLDAFERQLYRANVIGLPFHTGAGTYCEQLIDELNPRSHPSRSFCDALINVFLLMGGYLSALCLGRRVLLVNDQPDAVRAAMAEGRYSEQCLHYGMGRYPPWNIIGGVRTDSHPVPGDEQWPSEPLPPLGRPIDSYVAEAAGYDFDIALVGFGWRAVSFCPMLAERTGKVVLDMGHVLREIWLKRPQWRDGAFWGNVEVWAKEEEGL